MDGLRVLPPLAAVTARRTVTAGADLVLDVPRYRANQSETRVRFALPATAQRLGVKIYTNADLREDNSSIHIFVDFVPNTNNTKVWSVKSGFVSSAPRVRGGQQVGELQLKDTDTSLDIAVWTDAIVMEAFFMGGRGYWTVPVSCEAVANNTRQGVSVFTTGSADLIDASVWALNSIWEGTD